MLISHKATRHSEAKTHSVKVQRERGQNSNTFINPEILKEVALTLSPRREYLRPPTKLIQTYIPNSIWSLALTNKSFTWKERLKFKQRTSTPQAMHGANEHCVIEMN